MVQGKHSIIVIIIIVIIHISFARTFKYILNGTKTF